MTLDEAIAHLDESLSDQSHDWGCEECRQEHIQLRDWLVELRERRVANMNPAKQGYWWTYPDEEPDTAGNLLVWCSECDAEDHHLDGKKVPFCWHCGAAMSGEVKRLWEPPNKGQI